MRIRALIVRIIKQFIHDKRSLALMMLAPLLILFLMKLVFDGGTYSPRIGSTDLPAALEETLAEHGATLIAFPSRNHADAALHAGELDAVLTVDGQQMSVVLEGSDLTANQSVMQLLQNAQEAMIPAINKGQTHISFLHGSEDMGTFDSLGPVLIGFFSFFFVFLLSGVAFLRERTGGTLERLMASPLRRWEVVVGYVAGFGLFAMLQAALIVWFAVDLLNMTMAGSFGLMLLVTLFLSLTALTLGTFLSAFANNEFQMIQFIPLVIVPQVFFSGLFSLDTMSEYLRWLSVIMPLTYGADALREVMVRGGGWADIAPDIYVLLTISLGLMALNVLALKKHRKL
ncbi:ABC transporter permease [Xylanibacillus composti]|uniref:Transport permease protein n=1 Tax=Xylanibacillus composti TaxID=1572762 RepID=A0A8J4GZW4_9BACL|nr:ABC transporter permease [Xylanibacillus composti]MDT9724192.1 ABC transporter permease [Xylanibacillus composti]GIQ68293.1 transport permease protein [Xylanibacillus composti]